MEKTIKRIIQDNYAREAADIALFQKVRAALVPFAEKVSSRRMANAVQKELGDKWHVSYTGDKMRVTLCAQFINGAYYPEYSKGRDFYLPEIGPVTGGPVIFHFDDRPHGFCTGVGFDNKNSCYGPAAVERQKRREDLLADPARIADIARKIEAYNTARRAIMAILSPEDFDERIEDRYAIEALMEGTK